jgi:hypothetical protein
VCLYLQVAMQLELLASSAVVSPTCNRCSAAAVTARFKRLLTHLLQPHVLWLLAAP